MRKHMKDHAPRRATKRLYLKSLSYPGGERNLQPPSSPGFFNVLRSGESEWNAPTCSTRD